MKQRHGCLTAYLIFMMIANSATALLFLFGGASFRDQMVDMPSWAFPLLASFGIFNLVCVIAILKWKRWGFWGFCVSAVVVFGLNILLGLAISQSLGGLIGVAILFGILHIGKEKKGWTQLD